MIPLCEGEIYIDGEKVTLRNVRDAIKNGIACSAGGPADGRAVYALQRRKHDGGSL